METRFPAGMTTLVYKDESRARERIVSQFRILGLALLASVVLLCGCTTLMARTGSLTPEESCHLGERYEECVALLEPYFTGATRQRIVRRMADKLGGRPVDNENLIRYDGILWFLLDDMLLSGLLGDAAGADFIHDSYRLPRFIEVLLETGRLDQALYYADEGLRETFALLDILEGAAMIGLLPAVCWPTAF
jgi:hypothetical protein